MATKALLITAKFAKARKEHSCKANRKHKINQDDIRLEIKNERGWNKYCLECAKAILSKAKSDLQELHDEYSRYI